MTKSVYEFWISSGKEKIRIPVLPGALNVGNPSQNESINVSNLGEVVIIQDPAALTFGFSSFFPLRQGSFVEYKNFKKPWDIVKVIEKWKSSGEPIRFVVTGTPINVPVSIEDFSYEERGGSVGDIYYSLSLKEYKYVAVRKITVAAPKPPVKPRPKPKPKPKTRTYTVKKGDTLWALARKFYGNSLQWRKIWNANKKALIKRDKRNIKQPGHWIHIKFKIVIPK